MANLQYQWGTTDLQGFATDERKIYLFAGSQHLIAVLWNLNSEEVAAIEVFSNLGQWETEWPLIIQRSSLLALNHLEAEVFYTSPRSLLIPSIFFTPELARLQIDAVFGSGYSTYSGTSITAGGEAVLCWQTPLELYDTMANHFLHIRHSHVGMVLLHPDYSDTPLEGYGQVIFAGEIAWVSLWRNNRLLTLKTVSGQKGNFEYDLLNLCHQWGMANDQVSWKAAGFSETDADLWLAASQVINTNPIFEGNTDGNHQIKNMPDIEVIGRFFKSKASAKFSL